MSPLCNVALEYLPHRDPFRFLTNVEELVAGARGVGTWRVQGGEDFFAGHFPGEPVLPGVLIAEALAQLSGLVAFACKERPVMISARLAQVSVKFHSGVVPPAEVRLESVLVRELSGLYMFDVRAEVEAATVASGSLVLATAP